VDSIRVVLPAGICLSIEGKFIDPLKKAPDIVGGSSAYNCQIKLALSVPAKPVTVI
jgi:hypothetical protein